MESCAPTSANKDGVAKAGVLEPHFQGRSSSFRRSIQIRGKREVFSSRGSDAVYQGTTCRAIKANKDPGFSVCVRAPHCVVPSGLDLREILPGTPVPGYRLSRPCGTDCVG